ncbi:MAG TPA: nitroreductase [Epulopiscium sp.]|nr:nitroreductase [Candidatus Epulonipiscium sp.]
MKQSDLYKAIFYRKSIRKYEMTSLPEDLMTEIKTYINSVKYLDDSIKVELSYLETNEVKNLLPIKAPHYICVYSETKDGYLMNIGFILQQIDLYLSAKGIGSCWLGMAKPAKGILKQKEGMDFVIMLAFGNSEESVRRKDLLEFKRKELDDISTAKGANKLLEPVRIAPSATNSQPWFFTGNESELHLHRTKLSLIKTPVYGKMNQIDMGIAACHLYLSALEQNKKVDFTVKEMDPDEIPKGYQYMISATMVGKV